LLPGQSFFCFEVGKARVKRALTVADDEQKITQKRTGTMLHTTRFQFPVTMAACGILLAATGNAIAGGIITFNGDEGAFSGTGIGSVFTIMTLNAQGQTHTEAGTVSWNGTADVITGDAGTGANQTQTQLVSDLATASIDQTNIDLVLQVNQDKGGGNGLNVNNPFTLNVFDTNGNIIDSATFNPGPPNADTSALTGTGTGHSGWIFHVTGLLATDFATGTNRIGLDVQTINNASDGPETFFLANGGAAQPIPEPSSLGIAMTLFAGFGLMGVRRRRQRQQPE
jgi:hypothetical protein